MPPYCCGWRSVVIAGLLLMGGAVSLFLVNGTGLLPCPAGQPTKAGGDWPMFGGSPARAERTGYLRGSVKDAREMVERFRALGCTRLSIALREGPYDWDALEAFAAEIVRAR